jgi:hypothetical protein
MERQAVKNDVRKKGKNLRFAVYDSRGHTNRACEACSALPQYDRPPAAPIIVFPISLQRAENESPEVCSPAYPAAISYARLLYDTVLLTAY